MSPQAPPARPDSLRSVLGAGVLLALALIAVAGVKSHRDLAAAQARESELEATIKATEGRIAALRTRIAHLRDDPATLERLAREDLGLVRPHDLVIVLPGDGPPPPKRPQPREPAPAPAAPSPAPPAAPATPPAPAPTLFSASAPVAPTPVAPAGQQPPQ